MIKGLSDIQQKQIEELIGQFMTIETNLKKNGITLSSETISIIKEAKNVADFSVKENLPLPKSTYEILRYGPAVENQIFKNLDKLHSYSRVKVRVRKGIQYQHILTWDARAIDAILKKSDKPKYKSQDDKKVFKEFLSNFHNFASFENDLKTFNTYNKLFLAKNSPFTIHFLKGTNLVQGLTEKKTKLEERDKEKGVEQSKFDKLDQERQSLDQKISTKTESFYNEDKTGRGIKMKKDQIETLQLSDPLASYIKLLGDILETFDAYASKQNINLSFDEQNVLRDLTESIVTHEKSVDQHFTDLLAVIIRHADAAFGKKHWYTKLLQEIETADKLSTYLTDGPGYRAWMEAREFGKDVYELQQTPEFLSFQNDITELETAKKNLSENISRVSERLRRFTQDVKELQDGIDVLRSNLNQWSEEAQKLI